MKAVILAAGKGERMLPLTLAKPKPLLKAGGKSLIEHNLEQLRDLVDEVIIVIGYKGKMIQQELGRRKFGMMKLTFVEQKNQLGTGHALLQTEKMIGKERFIVMMGDDLYFRADMRRVLKYDLSVMAKRVENYWDFGVFIKKGDKILDLVEKPTTFVSDLANAAFYVFNEKIFTALNRMKMTVRKEYELTDGVRELAKTNDIFAVESKVWFAIGYPWNLLEVDQLLRDRDILIGKNSKVTGKVQNSTVGENGVIEGFVRNSIIGDNVRIHKGSVIEDSVIGDNVSFSGTIKTADKVIMNVREKPIPVENFGAVIGNDCKLIDVLIEPGTMLWQGLSKKGKNLKGIVKA